MGGGDMGGHVLRQTTSRGLCGLGCPSRTSERGGEGDCVKGGGGEVCVFRRRKVREGLRVCLRPCFTTENFATNRIAVSAMGAQAMGLLLLAMVEMAHCFAPPPVCAPRALRPGGAGASCGPPRQILKKYLV
jgi:hypothetical protein